ncbi:MAG: hypothetical protein JW797_09290 [Bradymonadales bacterium]|nr:hypothetical protein [Bradymonadales bacterium]
MRSSLRNSGIGRLLAGCLAVLGTWLFVAGGSGCVDPVAAPDDTPDLAIEILSVEHPTPLLTGSVLRVTVRGSLEERSGRLLRLAETGSDRQVDLDQVEAISSGTFEFSVHEGVVAELGEGSHQVDLVFVEGDEASGAYPLQLELAEQLALALEELQAARVFRNDQLVLRGSGIITPQEGSLTAELLGELEVSGEGSVNVAVSLPVVPAERFDRQRGVVRLSTAIGGLKAGQFEGTIRLCSELRSGSSHQSETRALSLEFVPPALFGYQPDEVALGQIVTFTGGGFLGHPEEPQEVTLLRFDGMLTPQGSPPMSFGPVEAVLLFVSGQEARWPIEVETRVDHLAAGFLGVTRGRFEGWVTPVTISGVEELAGEPMAIDLRVNGVRQLVVTRFLPGFWDSLRYYGLEAASQQVVEVAMSRMQAIWSPYALEFVLESPADFLQSAYSVLEIGGPDPNGLGLMGYENTSGKDVNNLRLYDQIGGANAATQADGFPGYGGVFIESFLYWSDHPPFSGPRPYGSPLPDPLFDEIFDPVREQPATLDEVEGLGEMSRVEVVARAIGALGSIVGETSAHEVGHSVGLAQPYEPVGHYHSLIPSPGCLMDAGADRPFGERAAQPGYESTRFCFDEPQYLESILGR